MTALERRHLIPADECGGGRKIAVMTEMFPTLQKGDSWPKQGPLQWVAKNRARDMERHYMQHVSDLQAANRALLAAHAKAKRELAIRRGIERELFA